MAYNDRRYSTLHSPDESQTYSLHTPVDSFNTPGPGPYNHPEHTGEHITHPTPFSSPSLSQNPSPYYPAPPLQQSNSFPIATSSRPLSMIPASAHNSPPGSPGLPPLPGVETFMMTTPQPARSPPPAFEGHQYQPAQFAPPPVSMSPPPAFNPLDPNPQAQQGATLPVPPQPLSTPTYIPSDASTGPQTPKTPVYTPGAASGPNGAIHAPGQIGHPNQQHGPTEYHNGMCSCFSDIPTCNPPLPRLAQHELVISPKISNVCDDDLQAVRDIGVLVSSTRRPTTVSRLCPTQT